MKFSSNFKALSILSLATVTYAHCQRWLPITLSKALTSYFDPRLDTFPDLIANNTVTADWQFVRITANHYDNGPVKFPCLAARTIAINKNNWKVTDVTSQPIRCYELDSTSASQAGIATVKAGSTVGFKADNTMGHPGVSPRILQAIIID